MNARKDIKTLPFDKPRDIGEGVFISSLLDEDMAPWESPWKR
jgi:hypothetical protein